MSEQKFYKLHFDKDGIPQSAAQRQELIKNIVEAEPPLSDLWVMSYGWDNDERGGDATYNAWLGAFKERIAAEIGNDPTFNPAFVGIYWPSRFWGEYMPPANAPTGGAYVLEGMVELEVADNPPPEPDNATKDEFIKYYKLAFGDNPNYKKDFGRLYDLLARDGSLSAGEVAEFVSTLQKYGQADPHPESFEGDNILDNPEVVQSEVMQGQTSNQEGLGDMFRGMTQKAFFAFTFWTMKNRAGVVGEKGVATFVRDLRQALRAAGRETKIHLMGHSFGGKVIGATLYGLSGMDEKQFPYVDSATLLMGAFSQFSFGRNIPHGQNAIGRYVSAIEKGVSKRPLAVVYSIHDTANRNMYPLGMRFAGSSGVYEAMDDNPEKEKLGAIGAYGARGVDKTLCQDIDLQPANQPYDFSKLAGVRCLNVNAAAYAKNMGDNIISQTTLGAHGDITGQEIYHLLLQLARS